jgi:hypothetical protein
MERGREGTHIDHARTPRPAQSSHPHYLADAAQVVLVHIKSVIIVHRQIVQVHREAQQGRDARHAVIRLAYNNGLPGEQPVELDGEAFASLIRGSSSVQLPSQRMISAALTKNCPSRPTK